MEWKDCVKNIKMEKNKEKDEEKNEEHGTKAHSRRSVGR